MNLTAKRKAIYLQIIIRRDGGFKCFYCKKDLANIVWIYEHLNNNDNHSEIENIVLACQSCNLKKINNYDMQILALEKLDSNRKMNLSYERENLDAEETRMSPEMDVSRKNRDITERYLKDIVDTDGSIEIKDALNSVAMLCAKKTGFGSQVSIRRYIDMLCSREGPFMIIKNESKKRVIVSRMEK